MAPPRPDKGKRKTKKVVARGTNQRRERREAEEEALRELEERIAAEVPARGRSGAFESTPAAEKKSAKGKEDGPSLTQTMFSELPISDRTQKGLKAGNFVKMTEIQRGAILRALAGRDILGEARTGSGKTLAFLVPLIELLYRRRWSPLDGLGALVVSPTRELSYQIFQVLQTIGTEHEISAACVVGGRSLEEEQKGVAHMNVIVATPGRLLQHLDESPGFDASGLLMLVLDEADRILDFGFQETIHNILGHLPRERQTLLFSATLRASVQRLGKAALRSPEVVSVHQDAANRMPEKLRQVYMSMPLHQKVDTLFSFLRSHSQKKIIVFVSACKQVRFLYEAFRILKPGPSVMELHGRQSLTKRLIIFQEFTEREKSIALFCTDIAARGVDFPAVDWVVQFDCPDCVESYIHRVGRTARYQSSGSSLLFLLPSERAFVDKLAAARISVQGISAKTAKVLYIQSKLASLLASDVAIKHLAKKAFASYMRSIQLMKDKEVFDVSALPREEFAQSLGLHEAPDLGDLGEADMDKNPQKKRKNQTALQRLKERIKQKRSAKQAAEAEGPASDDDMEADMKEQERRKLGRWERRQQRLERQRRIAMEAKIDTGAGVAAEAGEEDDFLQRVEQPEGGAAEAEVAAPVPSARQKRLRLRKDGSAVNALGKHTFFAGEEGRATSNELAQVAEDLQEEVPKGGAGGRAAFLKRVQKDLASRDVNDAATSRARIHEKHRKEKLRDRQDRRGAGDDSDDDGGVVAQLGSGSGDDGGSSGGGSDSGAEAAAPMRRPAPPAKRGAKKRQRLGDLPADAPGAPAAADGGQGAEDTLAAMERQALGRLGAGLFA